MLDDRIEIVAQYPDVTLVTGFGTARLALRELLLAIRGR